MPVDFRTDLPKHFVRVEGWLKACAYRSRQTAPRPIRYITLTTADAIDVFLLEKHGIVRRDPKYGFARQVYFCERSPIEFGRIAAVIGTPENGFQGDLFDLLTYEPPSSMVGKSYVDDIAAQYDLKERAVLHEMATATRLREAFPFDVINIDPYGAIWPSGECVKSIHLRGLERIMEWQGASTLDGKQLAEFTFLHTTPVQRSAVSSAAYQELVEKLDVNTSRWTMIGQSYQARFSDRPPAQLAKSDFLAFLGSVFPKVVLEQAATHGWIIEYRGVFAYSRGQGRPILSTVCHFRRPTPDEVRDLTNVSLFKNMDEAARVISEGIVNVDKQLEDDGIRRRIQEDLDTVVHLRDEATGML